MKTRFSQEVGYVAMLIGGILLLWGVQSACSGVAPAAVKTAGEVAVDVGQLIVCAIANSEVSDTTIQDVCKITNDVWPGVKIALGEHRIRAAEDSVRMDALESLCMGVDGGP